MTRDFANKNRAAGKKSGAGASRRGSKPAPGPAPWAWFIAGLACGVFLSALTWLASQQPDPAVQNLEPATARQDKRPGPRFDFYTLLPEQRIDIGVEPEAMATATADEPQDQYLLQAGSFKKAEDADRRRAQLLLLGLDASVEEANTDNGRWFRVYIGPFDSRSRLARARSVTAQQGIDTLLLKRPGGKG